MIDRAKAIVAEYLNGKCPAENYSLFVVWQVAALQNFKVLIATTHPHGMYFELTHDGDRERWYIDVYRKVENLEIEDGIHEQPNP